MDEHQLPIDIHLPRLVEWLVSRRHVQRDWPGEVEVVRKKINAAIQDMPEHPEVTRLLSGTYINYFHCLKIIDILKETEKDSKNILGWYGSQRMKDWQEVVRLYEHGSVYLAEAAQLLTRCVNYEVAGVRRLMAKGVQVQQECDNKEKEYTKGIAEAHKKYLSVCKQIGITGDNVKQELLESLKTLPQDFSAMAKECHSLGPACHLYQDFISFTLPGPHQPDCLPLLRFIMEHGNTTTYEWLYGEAPCSVEEPPLVVGATQEEEEGKEGEIDFGDGGDGDGIDFGAPAAGDGDSSGGIDWGALGGEGQPQEIDWGVGEVDEAAVLDIEVEDSGVSGGVARGDDARTLLLNPKTRTQFIDELHELAGFLSQRASELETEGTVFCLSQFSSAPASVQSHSADSVRAMGAQARVVIGRLSTTRMQHLLLISCSPRYVDRLAETLQAKLAVGDKLAALQENARKRKAATREEQKRLAPQLALMADRARELQGHVERDIAGRYKGRQVNIVGVNLSTHVA
ncbi:CDK5 regulatory subunit-associated protein 3 [Chionoecetes opilio]|uniref:CDK5 regulatory subunit-associated protein 3 n=1 Tax=Chionoecetes opilio TaxID=41210 RepID=A0A8J4YHH7_CHIOP|nr:CDK5 regulatory subunit-associated protein 3 [Chionoecetes opilio]